MSGLTLVFGLLFYVAIAVFVVGFLAKVWKYGFTPAPLKIPQTPAPVHAVGVVSRVFQDVVFFKSLFRGNKIIWVGGYLFHLGLLFVLLKHVRFFFSSTPAIFNYLAIFDVYSGFVLLAALAFLFVLRLAVDRHFYISVMTDYLLLLLLMGIALTGLLSKFWESGNVRANIPGIKEFVMGLVSFNPATIPANKLFMVHFTLVMLLLIYFPFSKLMHSGGIFFSPTRNQIDNPREKRHVTPWANQRSSVTAPGPAAEKSSDS